VSADRHQASFEMLASAGLIKGIDVLFKFGLNSNIDTGTTPQDIISLGGSKLFPISASTISLVSDSAQDSPSGTGLREILVNGLDSNFALISETIETDGLAPVVTNKEFFRVCRLSGTLGGSSQQAVGNIVATHSEGAISQILANYGESLDACYTVPRGHILLIDRLKASIERTQSGAGAEIHFEIKTNGQNVWQEKSTLSVSASGSSFVERDTSLWFPVPEETDLRIRVETVETNNTSISAAFDGLLINLSEYALC